MTKEEFKTRWESEDGGGINWDDIADCAKEWGVASRPKTMQMQILGNQVLRAAGIEPYFIEPSDDDW